MFSFSLKYSSALYIKLRKEGLIEAEAGSRCEDVWGYQLAIYRWDVVITDTARAWFFYSVYTTRNGLFGDNFTLGSITAGSYHRMPIDDNNMRFDPPPDPMQGYDFFVISRACG